MFKFACPMCHKAIQTSTDVRGKLVKCPACRQDYIVPEDLVDEPVVQPILLSDSDVVGGLTPTTAIDVQPVAPTLPVATVAVAAPARPLLDLNKLLPWIVIIVLGWFLFNNYNRPATPTPGPAPVPAPDVPLDAKSSLDTAAMEAMEGDKPAAFYFANVFDRAADLVERDGKRATVVFKTNEQIGESFVNVLGSLAVGAKFEKRFASLPAVVALAFKESKFATSEGNLTPESRAAAVVAFRALGVAFQSVADSQ